MLRNPPTDVVGFAPKPGFDAFQRDVNGVDVMISPHTDGEWSVSASRVEAAQGGVHARSYGFAADRLLGQAIDRHVARVRRMLEAA